MVKGKVIGMCQVSMQCGSSAYKRVQQRKSAATTTTTYIHTYMEYKLQWWLKARSSAWLLQKHTKSRWGVLHGSQCGKLAEKIEPWKTCNNCQLTIKAAQLCDDSTFLRSARMERGQCMRLLHWLSKPSLFFFGIFSLLPFLRNAHTLQLVLPAHYSSGIVQLCALGLSV